MGFRSRRWALISLLPLLHCMAETPPEFSAFPDLPPVTSALHAAPATLSAQGETEGDWCSRVAIRPDRRFSSVKPCVRTWSAEELTRECGTEIPASLQYYIDWDAMGRDMALNGDIFTVETGFDQVHIFWSR